MTGPENRSSYRTHTRFPCARKSLSRNAVASVKKWQRHAPHAEKREGFMKNDYLWDGSGEPDPELQRIEKSLARFSPPAGEMPDFPVTDFLQPKPSRFCFLHFWMDSARFAAATLLLLALTVFRVCSCASPPVELSNAPTWDVGTAIWCGRAFGKLFSGQ